MTLDATLELAAIRNDALVLCGARLASLALIVRSEQEEEKVSE